VADRRSRLDIRSMEGLDLSLENGMNHTSNNEATERHNIGDENPAHLFDVATY